MTLPRDYTDAWEIEVVILGICKDCAEEPAKRD
ncbi:hypothetical protein [Paenibacillus illinoisensis]